MNKNLIVIALLIAQPALFGCQVVVTNNTRDAVVTIFDERSNETRQANEGQAINGNTDADQHAHLIVTITHDEYPIRVYRLTQFACSKSHEIPITSSQIIHGILETKMADDMDTDLLMKVEEMVEDDTAEGDNSN